MSEVWEHYIDRKTLRWKVDKDWVVERVVGSNLILCCVCDRATNQLVCFPERHNNWRDTGYLNWSHIVTFSHKLSKREWTQQIDRVCAGLAKELKSKGIVGPDTPTPVHSDEAARRRVEFARHRQEQDALEKPRVVARHDVMSQYGNVEDPNIPEHAYRDSAAHAAEINQETFATRKSVPLSIHYMVTSRNRYTRCGMPVERLGKSKGHVWSSSWNIVTCSECLNQKMINASAQPKRKEKARPLETTIED